jgi:hypothetical protein
MTLPVWKKSEEKRSFPVDRSNPANHARYSVLVDVGTGRPIIVDGYKKRYDLMRNRVLNWANVMKPEEGEERFYKMISLTYDVNGTKIVARNWRPNDIRDFEVDLREYIKNNYPAIIIYGYAWVGEVMPISKNYHYHLVIVTSERLHFPNGTIEGMWGKGFIKLTAGKSPFYLVSYTKKKDQKDYFYFPWGARGFAVWVAPWATNGIYKSKMLLRFHSLKMWQLQYLALHRKGDDLLLDMEEVLSGVRAPPSNWKWVGSWVKLEKAESQVAELLAKVDDG